MLIESEDYKNGMKLEKGVLYNGTDGTYRYADNKMYSAVVKVPTPYGGEEIKEQIVGIKLPKIPYEMFNKIYEFFKHIYKEHKAEVAVLLWHNFETGVWETEVPKQKVSGGSVAYKRDEDWANDMNQNGFLCVGTIHSHCEMGAFHSGTDDHDEYNFDGVHITIGKVLSGPQFAQRFIVKTMSKKFDDIQDVVEFPPEADDKYPTEWFERVSKSYTPTTYGKHQGRKPSIFGGAPTERTNMTFNRDGSLRTPGEADEETTEAEEEITEAEKEKRASTHFIDAAAVYRCPICLEETAEHQLGKDFTCECGFPMWDDELDYELDYVKDAKGDDIATALRDTEDIILQDIEEAAINQDLKRFIDQDDSRHTV